MCRSTSSRTSPRLRRRSRRQLKRPRSKRKNQPLSMRTALLAERRFTFRRVTPPPPAFLRKVFRRLDLGLDLVRKFLTSGSRFPPEMTEKGRAMRSLFSLSFYFDYSDLRVINWQPYLLCFQ